MPRVALSPLDTPAKGNAVSLWIPYANRDALAPIGLPRAKGLRPSGHPAYFLRLRIYKPHFAFAMRSLENEFIANSRIQNPEQIFIAKETHEEIHTALQMIDE